MEIEIKIMLNKIYEIIEPSENNGTRYSSIYDVGMLICIIASMVPLAVKSNAIVFNVIDKVTVTLINVLKKQSKSLAAVLSMAIFYVLFTALIMFNIEPDTFNNFFDAIYWAAISLTSVGYGDITPISNVGRLFTMLSAFVGVAIIALPSGIVTAGYLDILHDENENR